MKKFGFVIFLLIIYSFLTAEMTRIDSLKVELETAAGSRKFEIYSALVSEYRNTNPTLSIEYGEKALKIMNSCSNERTIFIFLNDLGWAYHNVNESQPALELIHKALEIGEKSKKADWQAFSLNTLGAIYWKKNNYAKALEEYYKSLQIYEINKDQINIAKTKNNIGLIFFSTENLEKSLEYYFDALEIYNVIESKFDMAVTQQNIASVYGLQNEYEKSLEYSLSSLKLSEELEYERFTGVILTNTAITYLNMKRKDEALDFFNRALDITQKYDDKDNIARAYYYLGSIYREMGNLNKALKTEKDALKLAQEIDDDSQMKYVLEEISRIYAEKGNYKEAYNFHNKFKSVTDSLFNIESSEKITEMQTKYETEKKEHQIAILEKENKIDNMTRNYFIGGFIFVLIVSLILYNRYRERTKTNIKLTTANKTISNQNEQLQLISRILRHDIANNLFGIEHCLDDYFKLKEENCLRDVPAKITKSTNLIQRFSKISYLINEVNYTFPLDVRKIIDKLLPSYDNVEIEVNGEGKALADDLLESVLDNIISNAIKHGKTDRIKIDIQPDDECLQISIADFGIGIPEIIRDKIFEESFVYGDSGNTGLGLFIVKKAVENYGGSVEVKSNVPNGTVFVIRLKSVM